MARLAEVIAISSGAMSLSSLTSPTTSSTRPSSPRCRRLSCARFSLVAAQKGAITGAGLDKSVAIE